MSRKKYHIVKLYASYGDKTTCGKTYGIGMKTTELPARNSRRDEYDELFTSSLICMSCHNMWKGDPGVVVHELFVGGIAVGTANKRYPRRWSKTKIGVTDFHIFLKRALHEVLTNRDGVLADSNIPNRTVRHYLEQVVVFYGKPKLGHSALVGDSALDALVANLRDAVFNFANEENR